MVTIRYGSLVIILSMLYMNVVAKDFGKQGATFQVKEEGFIAMIQRKLKEVNIAEHEEKMQEIAKSRIEEPTPACGITRATENNSYSFDPSYVLDEDVYLPNGKLLYAAGTRVNPLDHMNWDGKLVFIDSRDKAQVDWMKRQHIDKNSAANDNKYTKIVLVGGRPLELEQETGTAIYFDQFGELMKRFGIKHVPATVQQDGKYLRVTEIDIISRN